MMKLGSWKAGGLFDGNTKQLQEKNIISFSDGLTFKSH